MAQVTSKFKKDGRKRIIISNVQPTVDNGEYPAKKIEGELFLIEADIISDGHDEIKASALYKHEKDKKWSEAPLEAIGNDHWVGSFVPEKPGNYKFKIVGWVDHFLTWKKGLRKKYQAGQDLDIEIKIGGEILEKTYNKVNKKEFKSLKEWSDKLQNGISVEEALDIAFDNEVESTIQEAKERSLATETAREFIIDVERKKAGFSAWYEFFPRSTSKEPGKHGTFKDCLPVLERVADLGFDTVYFPPIHPIGREKRKGRNNSLTPAPEDPGSPWAIGSKDGGHKSIHPELGTLSDFKALLKKAKKLDLEIALDIAFQCAPDHPWVKEHPEWFKWRPDGTVQYAENPPKKYEDILPINFESDDWENLWEELKSVVDYWIAQGVTIFRVDNPHTKAIPFWGWMINEVRKKHPEIIFLAEAFTRPRVMEQLAKNGFNQSYTYFSWRTSHYELKSYMEELTKTELQNYFRPNFWPNTPDILPPHLTAGEEKAHLQRLILAGTLSSNYGVYGPVYEFCINTPQPNKEEYIDSEKYEIRHWDWDSYTRVKEMMARLNHIRKNNPALQSTYNIDFAETQNEQLLGYAKKDVLTGNIILTVVNLDIFQEQSGYIRIPMLELGLSYGEPLHAKDLISGEKYTWYNDWVYIKLNPDEMPAHIFELTNG